MALTYSTQAEISFKNLLGKSQTDPSKGLVNESDGIFFNVNSNNIWLDNINSSPIISVLQGTVVQVTASMSVIPSSENHSCYTIWPFNPPSGTDIKTGLSFSYGYGFLIGITGGNNITNLVPDSYGTGYLAIPYITTPGDIPTTDNTRNWIYQYNSGIYYQDNAAVIGINPLPNYINVYAYIGNILSKTSNNNQYIIISATGTNNYYSTYSSPIISTYSSNYIYVVNFYNSNNSGTVSLNINNIGTYSVIKYNQIGVTNLNPGDIQSGNIYYLTYNNNLNNFIYYNNNPNQSPFSYINTIPTMGFVGGIDIGTSFINTTPQDVINDLLYPQQLGNIVSFELINNPGPFEIGNTMSVSTYIFNWVLSNTNSFINNSSKIEDISIYPNGNYWPYGGSIISGLNNNSGSYSYILSSTISSDIPISRSYRFSIERTNGTIISEITNVSWEYKTYYGTSTYSNLTQSGILNLGTYVINAIYGNWIIGGTSGYKYICFPSVYNVSNISYNWIPVCMADITDNSGVYTFSENNIGYQMLTLTNSFGVGNNYNIYRTINQISGTFTMTITN